jgi:hypothetical protein
MLFGEIRQDLNSYKVNNFIKVLKVSVRRCWVKHITGKKQETYLSISERHNLRKGDLVNKPLLDVHGKYSELSSFKG